jgi:hypothetical protein
VNLFFLYIYIYKKSICIYKKYADADI